MTLHTNSCEFKDIECNTCTKIIICTKKLKTLNINKTTYPTESERHFRRTSSMLIIAITRF